MIHKKITLKHAKTGDCCKIFASILKILAMKYIFIFIILFICNSVFSNNNDIIKLPLNVKLIKPVNSIKPELRCVKLREFDNNSNEYNYFFPGLESQLNSSTTILGTGGNDYKFFDEIVWLNEWDALGKVKKAKEIIDYAENFGRKIATLTGEDLVTMPVYIKEFIGQTEVTITFNSAKIYADYAEVEVHAEIVLPQKDITGKNVKLYFGANDLKFSQEKGLISGKIALLGDYAIKIGKSEDAAFILKKMVQGEQIAGQGTETKFDDKYHNTGTFISFSCDGFEEMGLGGEVIFSRDWVLPTDDFGEILQQPNYDGISEPHVFGAFQVNVDDWNDFMVEGVSISHFVLKDYQDISFYLGNANLDMSSYRNPSKMPEGDEYDFVEKNKWEGLYVETVQVTLPKPFQKTKGSLGDVNKTPEDEFPSPETERIKLSARHLLIDETGVSGIFSIVGQAPIEGGPIMNKEWRFSIDSLGVVVKQSELKEFVFEGKIGVPILSKDGPLGYLAWMNVENNDYIFEVRDLMKNKEFPLWNVGQVDVASVDIGVNSINGAPFTGYVDFHDVNFSLGNVKDLKKSDQGSKAQIAGINFDIITVRTSAPYISVSGPSLSGSQGIVSGFPVTITVPSLRTTTENEASLDFTLDVNLMDQSKGNISASGSFSVIGEYKRDINGARYWRYKKLKFEGAGIDIVLPQFVASGCIRIIEDDPVYGNGFFAGLNAGLLGKEMTTPADGKIEVAMMAIFGKNKGFRYFMLDAFAGGELINVPIVPPDVLNLTGFGGGVFHHMAPTGYKQPDNLGSVKQVDCSDEITSLSGVIYEPTKKTRLGIKFSTSFTAKGDLVKGLLTCIFRFDQNYALQNITLWGAAELMKEADISQISLPGLDDLSQHASKLSMSNTAVRKDAEDETNNITIGIKANLGVSIDFVSRFKFHTYASVNIKADDILSGKAQLDILVDPDNDEWHFYLGGYYDIPNAPIVEVPAFFGEENEMIRLDPATVSINYGSFNVQVQAYFLTGTKLPGPPPLPSAVVEFFGEAGEDVSNAPDENRNGMTCNGRSPATGSGMAFGASAYFDLSKYKKGFFGCLGSAHYSLVGMVGFDIALIKYNKDATCAYSGAQPMGINGFRASGNVFAFLDIRGHQYWCLPIPKFGIGLKAGFDVPNPSYFDLHLLLRIGIPLSLKIDLGEECGRPCGT